MSWYQRYQEQVASVAALEGRLSEVSRRAWKRDCELAAAADVITELSATRTQQDDLIRDLREQLVTAESELRNSGNITAEAFDDERRTMLEAVRRGRDSARARADNAEAKTFRLSRQLTNEKEARESVERTSQRSAELVERLQSEVTRLRDYHIAANHWVEVYGVAAVSDRVQAIVDRAALDVARVLKS